MLEHMRRGIRLYCDDRQGVGEDVVKICGDTRSLLLHGELGGETMVALGLCGLDCEHGCALSVHADDGTKRH